MDIRPVSVPKRGFVALIRTRPSGTHVRWLFGFSPQAGIRGFDTSTRDRCRPETDHRFSPQAGIRGFDTSIPQ